MTNRSFAGPVGGLGGVLDTQPWAQDGPPDRRDRRPFDRSRRLSVALAAFLVLVLVGSAVGELVYRFVEHPKLLVVSINGAGCGGFATTDRFQLWADPVGFGQVVGTPASVKVDPKDPRKATLTFEIDRHTPDFEVVDVTTGSSDGTFTYAEVANLHSQSAGTLGCLDRAVLDPRIIPQDISRLRLGCCA